MAQARAAGLSNSDARTLFMNSAIRKVQWSNPSQTPAAGTTLSVVLPKAGVARAILVTVSVPITIGTAVCVPSPKAPFVLFTNAHLQDYAGIDRVNASVFMLSQLQMLKQQGWEPPSSYPYVTPGGPNTTDPYVAASYPFGVSAPDSARTQEGGGPSSFSATSRWKVPTAATSDNLVFSFWVPVAYGMKDTRGALLLNVPNGQVVLQLTINNNLVATTGIDQLYQSGTGTCVFNSPTTSNIYVYTYYYDPVAVPGVPASSYPGSLPIPYEDLQLVHEVRTITVPNFFAASA